MTLLERILHSESTAASGWEHQDLGSGAFAASAVVMVVGGRSKESHLYDSALVVDEDEPMRMLSLANRYERSASYGEYEDAFETDSDLDSDSLVFTITDPLEDVE